MKIIKIGKRLDVRIALITGFRDAAKGVRLIKAYCHSTDRHTRGLSVRVGHNALAVGLGVKLDRATDYYIPGSWR